MIAPASLSDLLTADPLRAWQAAIVAELASLLPGVKVVSHPGKIDISQMLAKTVVPAPGVAVGWTRVRTAKVIDGTVDLTVEWAAYAVVEDKVIGDVRIDRDRLAFALGTRLLMILADPEATAWGLTSVTPPAEQPAPQLVPLFTIADQAKGVGYLAVTWTQSLVGQGDSLFAGPVPVMTAATDDDGRASIEADFGGDVPPDVRALWQEDT